MTNNLSNFSEIWRDKTRQTMNKKEPLQNLALSTLLINFFHVTFLQDCKKIVLYEKQNHNINSINYCIVMLIS